MKLGFIIAVLLATSPVAAQTLQVQQPLGAGGVTNNSPLTDTGVICQEEMVATFCNVASSPNHAGYGTCSRDQPRDYYTFSGYRRLRRRRGNCQRAVQLRSAARPVVGGTREAVNAELGVVAAAYNRATILSGTSGSDRAWE